MKILKQEKQAKSQIKLTVEVSKEELAKFLEQAYEKLKGQVKVSGFRPGKAPRNIVEKEIGSERFQQEALEIALPETYYQAIKEAKLMPIGPPEIKMVKFVPSDALVYEATISVVPEINLGDYKKIISQSGIKIKNAEVEDKQIEEVIKNLQKQKSETKEVLRESKKGDRVEIDFESFVDGKPIAGGASQNHPLVIGDNVMVPGFEEAIIGMKKSEEKEFNLTFPVDFYKKELAGKNAQFKAKMKQVNELKLPEVNDELAKKLGHKDLTELKKDIKKSLEKEFSSREELKFEGELIEKLIAGIEIEIPQFLIKEELSQMTTDFEQRLAQNGLTLDRYLEQLKKTKEDLTKEWEKEAEKRIKIALILDKIAQEEKISISDKDVENEIKKVLENAPAEQKAQAAKNLENEEQKKYIKNVLKNRKVIEFLKDLVI